MTNVSLISRACVFLRHPVRSVVDKLHHRREKEAQAATKIQSAWRGRQARTEVSREIAAATKIQSGWRGHQARAEVYREKEAAAKIQSAWRGHYVRVARSLLDPEIFKEVTPYVHNRAMIDGLDRASAGQTRVYLAKRAVIKMSGYSCFSRWMTMISARHLCERKGFRHLVIPEARIYRGGCEKETCLLERKLPININSLYQYWIYQTNSERFTEAVREFIGFVCLSGFSDFTGPRSTFSNVVIQEDVRWDNIPLFLDGDEGKIGLIDLEHVNCNRRRNEGGWLGTCGALVNVFPKHFDLILAEIAKFFPDVEKFREELEAIRNGALERNKLLVDDHLAFCERNRITHATSREVISGDSSEIDTDAVIDAIRRLPIIKWWDDGVEISIVDQEKNYALLKEELPHIFALTQQFLSRILHENKQEIEKVDSDEDLLNIRTVHFDHNTPWYRELLYVVKQLLPDTIYLPGHSDKIVIAMTIINFVLKEMQRKGQILYFHPERYGMGWVARRLVLC